MRPRRRSRRSARRSRRGCTRHGRTALRQAADAEPRLKRLRKRGGFALPFSAPAPGTLAIRWSARRGGKTVVVARGAAAVDGAGEVRVRLTNAGRKLLKGRKRARISMRLRFTPDGGEAVTVTGRPR